MKLYFNKFSRGTRPRWLLEEATLAGVDLHCEIVPVDMQAGEHKSAAYLALHPHGQVPVLVDGETPIIESAAITLHLADKAVGAGLAPAVGTVERGLYYQWIVYAMATLEPHVATVAGQGRKPEGERDAAVIAEATRKFHACLAVISAALEGKDWLVANRFSAADVVICGVLLWANMLKLCAGFPVIEAYLARATARPGFQASRR